MAGENFKAWAVVELMGHRRLVGYCCETELAGGKMLRIDVPENGGNPAFTEFHGNQAIYGITPVEEDVARALLEREDSQPWFSYALPKSLPKPDSPSDDEYEDYVDDDDPTF